MKKIFERVIESEVFLIAFAVGFCLFLFFTKNGGWG
jgi:hypothetical protein